MPGAVDFLRDDLTAIPSISRIRAGAGYLIARIDGPVAELGRLRTYSSIGLLLATGADRELGPEVVGGLRELADQLAAVAAGGETLRYRVGASVPDRQRLIDAIDHELGWENSPSRWHVNIERHDRHLMAQIGSMFLTRRLGPLARLPASTTPIIAEVMVRLAKLQPGQLVLDCFCGAGTILVTAAARDFGASLGLVGLDNDRRALAAASQNLGQRGSRVRLAAASAERLPVRDLSVDRIVSNLPFGKRVGSHRGNELLYPAFLREAERVLAPGGRIVLLSEDKALLRQSVQRTHRIKIVREVLLRSGGATPTAFVVTRNRQPRPRRTTGGG